VKLVPGALQIGLLLLLLLLLMSCWCDCSADEASTADEDVDNFDEEFSDDWSVTRASGRMALSRSTRRSNRQRRRPARMNNFGMP